MDEHPVDDGSPTTRELAHLQRRVELVERARRALDLVGTEEEAHAITAAAVRSLVPGRAVRIAIDADDCHGARRHGPTVSVDGRDFDACPHLRDLDPPASGVCVPVAIREEILGVLQWEGEAGTTPDRITTSALDTVAHLLALRLVVLRNDPAVEAPRTDPLTGLLNRRSTTRAIRTLVHELVPFSLAVCDLDAFDDYNLENGHDVGDRALQLFAETLSSVVRPNDIVGRTGGDSLTVVFPNTAAIDARQALERLREVLVLKLAIGEIAPFTASYGVADSNQGDSIESIVETAAIATALAKRSGTNRVVVAGEETTGLPRTDTASDQGGDGL